MSSSYASPYSSLATKPRRASTPPSSQARPLKAKSSSKSPLRSSTGLVGASASISRRSALGQREKPSPAGTLRSSSASPSTSRNKSPAGLGHRRPISRKDSLDLNETRSKTTADPEERELRALLSKYGRHSSLEGGRGIPASSSRFEEEEKDEDTESQRDSSSPTLSKRGRSGSGSRKVRGILSTAKSPLDRNPNQGRRKVTFNRMATVHHMPGHEQLAARRSRKGPWEPAPEHDELWDGDLQEFRPVPLTSRELKDFLQRRDREASFEGMSYTYPPASYEFSPYADGDMDELDSYLNEMPFSSSLDSARLGSDALSTGSRSSRVGDDPDCYICHPAVDWSPRQVGNYVRDHVAGGDFLCLHFDEHYVDGPMLLQMEERDLRNIGIKRRTDRLAILSALHELQRGALSKHRCSCTNAGASNNSIESEYASTRRSQLSSRSAASAGSSSSSSSHDVFDRHSQFLKDSETFLQTF